MKLKELREQRAALWSQERAQLDRLKAEGQALIGDAREQYEARAADIEKLDKEIEGFEKLEAAASRNREHESRVRRAVTEPERGAESAGEQRDLTAMLAFRGALKAGGRLGPLTPDEKRAFQAGVAESGGYLVAPQQFIGELLKNVDDAVFMRGWAKKMTVTNAESIGQPRLDTDAEDSDWTAELATGNEEDSITFGKREMRPHPMAKRVKVSKKLLRIASLPVDSIIRERMAFKAGVTQEKAFLSGDGLQKPLGVFTAHADGIPTSRDVSTGNTTTAITADGLIEAKHFVKGAYWNKPGFRWLFHRDAIKHIRKLKLSDNQYIWQPGLSADLPARILDVPYAISEYVPNTFTTGLYVGLIGDFGNYQIVDALSMTVEVLNELYAETNQIGYILRMETDGAPVLSEAFARVKLA